MFAGDGTSLAACLRAYGFEARDLNAKLRRRLMVFALLNRSWGLDVMLEYDDPAHRCATLAELASDLSDRTRLRSRRAGLHPMRDSNGAAAV